MPTRTIPVSRPPRPAPSSHAVDPAAPERVRLDLIALPFPDYVARVALLMSRMGYSEVQPLGPLHEKGRNAHGAHDIRAVHARGLTRSAVIAQAKQYSQPVPRNFVDELRGAMLRTGAQQGLLFTTSEFAPSAVEAAQAGQHAAPVRLVAGEEMARLMLSHGIGSDRAPSARKLRRAPSEADRLEREFLAGLGAPRPVRSSRPPATSSAAARPAGGCLGVSVTVLVGTPPGPSGDSRPSRP